jgi:hypothetical protein
VTGVVLRCANCGTVQASPGECEACHEGEVRYFCTNHDPGLWLETPVCSACGAKFGEVRADPPARSTVEHGPFESEPAEPALSPSPESLPEASRSPWRADEDAEASLAAEHDLALRRLHEALESSSRGAAWPTEPSFDGEPMRPARGGCGKVALLLVLLVLMFVLIGPLLLGSALIGFFF